LRGTAQPALAALSAALHAAGYSAMAVATPPGSATATRPDRGATAIDGRGHPARVRDRDSAWSRRNGHRPAVSKTGDISWENYCWPRCLGLPSGLALLAQSWWSGSGRRFLSGSIELMRRVATMSGFADTTVGTAMPMPGNRAAGRSRRGSMRFGCPHDTITGVMVTSL